MKSPATVSPPSPGRNFSSASRRDFLRAAAATGAAATLPSLLSGCQLGDTTFGSTSTPTGTPLVIDFAGGDIAFLKFVSIYKQVQAEVYTKTVAAFTTSDLTTAQQAMVSEIKNHEAIHRDTVAGVLGSTNQVTPTLKFGNTDFKTASSILNIMISFEDVGVGLLNGMIQRLISSANIAFLLEMQSVEARHSASLRDLLSPKNGTPAGFSPGTADGSYTVSGVAAQLQFYITEQLQFTNAPAGL
jgi:hypothetical protein